MKTTISRLHYITQDVPGKTHVQLAEEACKAGVNWVQLRLKNKSGEEWKAIALETLAVCRAYRAKLIINDNAELAGEIGADGVHLGKEDLSTARARQLLGNDFIIGGTANTFADIQQHIAAGVDYVGLGPFRFTATKEKLSPVLGTPGYAAIMKSCAAAGIAVPVIAIGGILAADVEEITASGIYGVAVAGAIAHAVNRGETVSRFLDALNNTRDLNINYT